MWTLKSNELQWTYSMIIWPLLYGWSEKKTYDFLIQDIGNGLKPGWSLDIFAVIVGSHVFSIFSDTLGNYVLYIVPLYLLYKGGEYGLSYLKSKSQAATTEDPTEDDPQEKKKQDKKER